MNERIVLAGGSGFLGQALAKHFLASGHEVVVLTRNPRDRLNRVREVKWDGETMGDWAGELEGAAALINLAGLSVNCRYHAKNRKLLVDSRIKSTRVLGDAVARCKNPPPVWLNSSTATIYRHTFGPPWDENGEIGGTREAKDEFSIDIATAWERTFNEVPTPQTRKVIVRSAMVLGNAKNSVFPAMRKLVLCGLGGKMASGRQFVSWIHERDYSRAVEFLIRHDDISGIVNLAAPTPVTNDEMMRTLRGIYRVPLGLPSPLWMLGIGAFFLRTETELLIKSRRVISRRLPENGFNFEFETMEDALRDLAGRPRMNDEREERLLHANDSIEFHN